MPIKTHLLLLSILLFGQLYSSEKGPTLHPLLYPIRSTSLHIAIYESNFELVIKLIQQGANPLEPDEQGTTPLDIVNDIKTLYVLLSSPYREKFTQQAVRKGHTRILATLFSLNKIILPKPTVNKKNLHLENYNLDRHFTYHREKTDQGGYLFRLISPQSSIQPATTLLKK